MESLWRMTNRDVITTASNVNSNGTVFPWDPMQFV